MNETKLSFDLEGTKKFARVCVHSISSLATLYNVSRTTMRCWLKPHQDKIGIQNGRYYTIKQVSIIFSILGRPFDVLEDD